MEKEEIFSNVLTGYVDHFDTKRNYLKQSVSEMNNLSNLLESEKLPQGDIFSRIEIITRNVESYISRKDTIPFLQAKDLFETSMTYLNLQNEKTKLWTESSLKIYIMYKMEQINHLIFQISEEEIKQELEHIGEEVKHYMKK